jgi:phospholipid/cholesterol/gamma-HCH transport system substrate-binding protein
MSRDGRIAFRVGLLVLAALAVAAVGIALIGEESSLFRRKNRYFARFRSVSGLNPGSPVQLNGVKVGTVREVVLPEDPGESLIRVEIAIDRRYAARVRGDSQARINTLGLLGDKYVEIASGSEAAALVDEGSEIPAASGTAVDALVESGGDAMANVTEISASLRDILARMERGEGVLGALVSDRETGRRVTDTLVETLDSVKQVAKRIENGEGALPRLITDRELADRLTATVARLEGTLARLEGGPGLLPALLNDAAIQRRFEATLASLEAATADLAAVTRELREGEGLLPRLLFDETYGREVSGDLERAVDRLSRLAEKLEGGDGTLQRLLDDPSIYEALEDIVVGVEESRMLRWLLRNRQRAGIEKRYRDAQGPGGRAGEGPAAAAPPPEPPPPASSRPTAEPASPAPGG